jgi:hypothetical protein
MFQLGIDPPNYVYTVTLPDPAPFLIPDVGTPGRVPAWQVILKTPPGSVGPPRPVLHGRPPLF